MYGVSDARKRWKARQNARLRNLTVARREARERVERVLAEHLGVERARDGVRGTLPARVRAVAGAEAAFARDEAWAKTALRSALLELAATAAVAAEQLDLAEVEQRVDEEPAPV